MVTFDNSRNVEVRMSFRGVSSVFRANLMTLGNDPLMKGSGIGDLSPTKLRALLEYTDHRFRVDPKSPLRWEEQFKKSLSKDCRDLLLAKVLMTPEELRTLMACVHGMNAKMAIEAGARDIAHKVEEVIDYQYHDGFNHMTRDDDFIAVRRGGRVVSIIALPGNDFNEMKKFLKAGGDLMLTPENIEGFRKYMHDYKKAKAYALANMKVEREVKVGISLTRKD